MSEAALLPPDQNLRLVYVVPVRGQVTNGLFFTQLEDLTNQRELHKSVFEVLYVRHNPKHNKELASLIEIENTIVLEIVQFLHGERSSLPLAVTGWQEQIVKKAKENRLRVQTVSTEDINPTEVVSPRAVGANLARERFKSLHVEGIIVHADIDTGMGVRSTYSLIEQFRHNPRTGMLVIDFPRLPEVNETTLYKLLNDPVMIFERQVHMLRRAVQGKSQLGWYALTSSSLEQQKIPWEIHTAQNIHFYVHTRPQTHRNDSVVALEENHKETLTTHPALTLGVYIYEHDRDNAQIREGMLSVFEKYFAEKAWYADVGKKIEQGEFIQDHIQWLAEYTEALTVRDFADAVYAMVEIMGESTKAALAKCVELEKKLIQEENEYSYANHVLKGVLTYLEIYPLAYLRKEFV